MESYARLTSMKTAHRSIALEKAVWSIDENAHDM
jgi:hypothetical protein